MSLNVRIITGTKAKVAARLCNYKIGVRDPLPEHTTWLDANVKAIVQGNPNAWIDLIGHASKQWKHTGGTNSHLLNLQLSQQRCARLKEIIKGYNKDATFNIVYADGDVDANPKDDGYDRAVELYVYAAPPPSKPDNPPPPKLVRRIVERKFMQISSDNDRPAGPDSPSQNLGPLIDVLFGVVGAAISAGAPEAVLEPYEQKPPKVEMMPDTNRVNKVVIRVDTAETFGGGALTTVTTTTVTYTWGSPRPMVEIQNVETASFQGQEQSHNSKTINLSRQFAEDKPFVVPPPP